MGERGSLPCLLEIEHGFSGERAVPVGGALGVRQPVGEHEVDRLGRVEAVREAGVVGLGWGGGLTCTLSTSCMILPS